MLSQALEGYPPLGLSITLTAAPHTGCGGHFLILTFFDPNVETAVAKFVLEHRKNCPNHYGNEGHL
jgi:hypothetical protein